MHGFHQDMVYIWILDGSFKKLGNHTNKYTDKMTGKRKIVCNMKQKKFFDVRKRHSM